MDKRIESGGLEKAGLWSWGNEVLYRMCREEPGHTKLDVIAGKVWLIGRAYAAAIERGAGGYADIYSTRVAPMMKDSDIDHWIASVGHIERVTNENAAEVLRVHNQVTDLFNRITGLEKRSLASKYLHFHQPKAFFIFDTIANAKLRLNLKGRKFKFPSEVSDVLDRCIARGGEKICKSDSRLKKDRPSNMAVAMGGVETCLTPYAEFVYRCLWYRDNVFEPMLGRESTPRELDQHLLGY